MIENNVISKSYFRQELSAQDHAKITRFLGEKNSKLQNQGQKG